MAVKPCILRADCQFCGMVIYSYEGVDCCDDARKWLDSAGKSECPGRLIAGQAGWHEPEPEESMMNYAS